MFVMEVFEKDALDKVGNGGMKWNGVTLWALIERRGGGDRWNGITWIDAVGN